MGINDQRISELADRLAKAMGIAPEGVKRPSLRLVSKAEGRGSCHRMDAVTRESQIRWLRALRRHLKYMQVELFFEQALLGRRDLEDLGDDELVDLHRTIDQARDHYHNNDGVSYYEAGLLRRQEDVA